MQADDLLDEILQPSERMGEWVSTILVPRIKESDNLEHWVSITDWEKSPEFQFTGMSVTVFVATLINLGYDVTYDYDKFIREGYSISLKSAMERKHPSMVSMSTAFKKQ